MSERISVDTQKFRDLLDAMKELAFVINDMVDLLRCSVQLDPDNAVTRTLEHGVQKIHEVSQAVREVGDSVRPV